MEAGMSITPLALTLLLAARVSSPFNDNAELSDVDLVTSGTLAPTDEQRFSLTRAAWELGALMAIGGVWYETEIELNRRDFDFETSWSGQWQRLATPRGYRFDDNDRSVNVAHAFVGRTYHALARANHASMLQAFLFDLTASSLWESTIEHQEVFSLNDTVVTAVGGVPLGESFFQLGEFFARSRPTWFNRAAMAVMSPGRALALLSGELPPARASSVDRHGLAADGYHRFVLSAGSAFGAPSLMGAQPSAAAGAGGGASLAAALDLELINLRAYGHEGEAHVSLAGGEATRLQASISGTVDHIDALAVSARTSLFGRYTQDVTGDGEGDHRRGAGVLVAAGSAFDLSLTDRDRQSDFLTAIHTIGPTVDALLLQRPLTFRLAADLYGDFAMVRPFALDPLAPVLPAAGETKSVLQEHQYYYAWGLTAAARAEARFAGARAGVGLEWNEYDSIQGLDRHQDAFIDASGISRAGVADDFALTDQRLKMRLYSEIPTPLPEVHVGLSLDLQRRSGEMKDLARTEDEARAAVLLSYAM
jgi:hypothetical protein